MIFFLILFSLKKNKISDNFKTFSKWFFKNTKTSLAFEWKKYHSQNGVHGHIKIAKKNQ